MHQPHPADADAAWRVLRQGIAEQAEGMAAAALRRPARDIAADGEWLLLRGEAVLAQGRAGEAVRWFRLACRHAMEDARSGDGFDGLARALVASANIVTDVAANEAHHAARMALALAPAMADGWAALASGLEDGAAADRAVARALVLVPGHGAALCRQARGIARAAGAAAACDFLVRQGRLDAVGRQAGRSADRRFLVLLHDAGLHAYDAGRMGEAAERLRQVEAAAAGSAPSALVLGFLALRQWRLDEALDWFGKAVVRAPRAPGGHAGRVRALVAAGRLGEALDALRAGCAAAPGDSTLLMLFADLTMRLPGAGYAADRALVLDCLTRPGIEPERIAPCALRLALAEDGLGDLLALAGEQDEDGGAAAGDALRACWLRPARLAALEGELARPLLRRIPVPDIRLERLLTALRDALVALLDEGMRLPAAAFGPAVTLAMQAFNTGFAWEETPGLAARADRLAERLAERLADRAAGPLDDAGRLILAALAQCRLLPEAAERLAEGDEELGRLVDRHIREPARERMLAQRLARTEPGDDVTRRVAGQYAEHPYPAWTDVFRPPPHSPGLFLRWALPCRSDLPAPPDDLRILVAGCGSGMHPVGIAMRYPRARVVALDISLPSLGRAMRMAERLGVGNIAFHHADLRHWPGDGARFDLIECVGVLHHLERPLEGWQALLRHLAPDGLLKIGLYSDIARRQVTRASAWLAAEGHRPTPAGIRAARAALARHPDHKALAGWRDCATAGGFRDLLMHACEHRFTLPQIGETLDALGLEFLGFDSLDPALAASYRRHMPQDAPQGMAPDLAPDLTMDDLRCWDRFERDHPASFLGMYQFFCRLRSSAGRTPAPAPARGPARSG